MKTIITSVAILSAVLLSACSLEQPEPIQKPKSFKYLVQKLQADQLGFIQKLEINNIELERTTTGAKQTFASYSYTYSPALEVFESLIEEGETTDIYTMGIKQGEDIIDLQLKYFELYDFDTDIEEFWMEINGIRYDITLEINESANLAFLTLKPTQPVPGTSNDYTNLINALNLGSGPQFNLANLRVLSLDNIKLTIAF